MASQHGNLERLAVVYCVISMLIRFERLALRSLKDTVEPIYALTET
jgi:hypothetical protein